MLLGDLPLTVRCRTVSVRMEDGQCREVAGRARGQLLESSTAALLDERGLLGVCHVSESGGETRNENSDEGKKQLLAGVSGLPCGL